VQPKIYFVNDHTINPDLIDPDALQVLDRLKRAGFTAYLVGGSVRDLLVKKIPKDYDISTSAKPEEIKAIFQRQCILIGKRFRLAHIRFGHKIIEVSTFRAGENVEGLILQDNVWGTPEQDVLRRDFTINGLFYDASNHSVIDYVDGWEDIQNKILRTIGTAEIRFKQDPVRLLRLIKFRARFGFAIDEETEKAIWTCRQEIVKSSPARILEEILRMLESGYSASFFRLLMDYGFLALFFPNLAKFLRSSHGTTIFQFLASADRLRRHKDKNVLDRSVFLSCLIFPILQLELHRKFNKTKQYPHLGEITLITSALIKETFIQSFVHFPRRLASLILSILVTQYRLTPLSGRRHYREKMFLHKEFQLGLHFLKIRALVDEKLVETYSAIRDQYRQVIHQRERKHHPPPAHEKHPVLKKATPHVH
jgi:poly(A) polymerase